MQESRSSILGVVCWEERKGFKQRMELAEVKKVQVGRHRPVDVKRVPAWIFMASDLTYYLTDIPGNYSRFVSCVV